MHGKGGSKKEKTSENSGKGKVRTAQSDIMKKANELLGGGQNGGNRLANSSSNLNKESHIIGGAKSLLGRYGLSGAKAIGSGALRTVATASGAMLGFANGVAKGDVSEAFKGAVAGGTLGDGLAKSGMNFASNLGTNIKNLGNDIQDTYNEGAYGTEYAQNIKMVREFKQTSGYKELRKTYGDQLTDEKLSEILRGAMAEQNNAKK